MCHVVKYYYYVIEKSFRGFSETCMAEILKNCSKCCLLSFPSFFQDSWMSKSGADWKNLRQGIIRKLAAIAKIQLVNKKISGVFHSTSTSADDLGTVIFVSFRNFTLKGQTVGKKMKFFFQFFLDFFLLTLAFTWGFFFIRILPPKKASISFWNWKPFNYCCGRLLLRTEEHLYCTTRKKIEFTVAYHSGMFLSFLDIVC